MILRPFQSDVTIRNPNETSDYDYHDCSIIKIITIIVTIHNYMLRSTKLAALELMDRNVNAMHQNNTPVNVGYI